MQRTFFFYCIDIGDWSRGNHVTLNSLSASSPLIILTSDVMIKNPQRVEKKYWWLNLFKGNMNYHFLLSEIRHSGIIFYFPCLSEKNFWMVAMGFHLWPRPCTRTVVHIKLNILQVKVSFNLFLEILHLHFGARKLFLKHYL